MRWTILLTAALTGCFLVPVETECTPQSVLDACLDDCVDDAEVCFDGCADERCLDACDYLANGCLTQCDQDAGTVVGHLRDYRQAEAVVESIARQAEAARVDEAADAGRH